MKIFSKQKFLLLVKISVILLLALFTSVSLQAWSVPSSSPTAGDSLAPINASDTHQIKGATGTTTALLRLAGKLSVQGLSVFSNPAQLIGLTVDSLSHTESKSQPICINSQKKLVLCGAASSTDTMLTTLVLGTGTGVIFSNDVPRTIACVSGSNINCSHSYPNGKPLTLTAGQTLGVFAGWGGDCLPFGMNQNCSLDMTTDHSVSARFDPPGACSVTTAPVTAITDTTALSGGTIVSDGGGIISAGGIEYGVVGSAITKTAGGYYGSSPYVSVMSSLTSNTNYRVRAYATNGAGRCNGSWLAFTTLGSNALPGINNPTAQNITKNSADLGATITSLGYPTLSARGTCYSELADPKGQRCLVASGTGLGAFSHTRTGLSSNKKYYYVGYAENSIGRQYTDIMNFTTLTSGTVPVVANPQSSSITNNSAVLSANITSAGIPATITERGFCYGFQADPRSNCIAEGGTTTGVFSKTINGLSPNTAYHFVGYAKNTTGAGYSVDGTFTTTGSSNAVSVTTLAVTNITNNSATGHGAITVNGATVTEKGLVWGRDSGPRTWDNCSGGVCNKYMTSGGAGNVDSTMSKDIPWNLPTTLGSGAKYYVRAYAIVPGMTFSDPLNSGETSDHLYGNQVEFTTTLPTCAPGSFSQDTYGPFTFKTSSIPGFPYCVFGKLTFSILGAGGGGGGAAGATGEPFVLQGAGGGGGGQGGSLTFEISVSNPEISKTFSGQIGKGGSGGNGGEAGNHSGDGGSSGTSTTLVMPEGTSLSVAGGAYGNAGHWNCVGGSLCIAVPGAGGAGGLVTGVPSIPNVIPGSVSFSSGSNGFSGVLDEIDCSGDGGHGGGNALGGAGGVSGGQKNGYSCSTPEGYGGDGGGGAPSNGGGGGGGGGGLGGRWWNFFTFSWIPVPHSGGPGGGGEDGRILITW